MLKKLLLSVYQRQVDTCDFSVKDYKVKSCEEVCEDRKQDAFLARDMEANLVIRVWLYC